jgi:hypothetical protein
MTISISRSIADGNPRLLWLVGNAQLVNFSSQLYRVLWHRPHQLATTQLVLGGVALIGHLWHSYRACTN